VNLICACLSGSVFQAVRHCPVENSGGVWNSDLGVRVLELADRISESQAVCRLLRITKILQRSLSLGNWPAPPCRHMTG